MFHKNLDIGLAGDQMGTLLRGFKREEVRRGMVLAKPNSYKSVKFARVKVRLAVWICMHTHTCTHGLH